ncbi:hypothetical protein Tco_1131079, partial [Tanacetum coccineum]
AKKSQATKPYGYSALSIPSIIDINLNPE